MYSLMAVVWGELMFARRSPGITFTVHAPAIYRASLKREISVHGVRFRLFFGRPGVEIPDRRLA
jgi:hypothetical protein